MPLNVPFTKNQAQDAAGELLKNASGNVSFGYDADNNILTANAPEAQTYELSTASESTLGGVKIGVGVTVNPNGTISVEDTRIIDVYLAGKELNIDTNAGSFSQDLSGIIPAPQVIPTAVKSIAYSGETNLLATLTDNSQVTIDLADFKNFIVQQAQTATQINSFNLTGTNLTINTNAKGNQSVDLSSLTGSRIIYQKPGRNMAYQTGNFYYSDAGVLYEFIGTGFVAASNLSPSANMRRVAGVGTAMTNVARIGNNLIFTLSDGQTLTRDITPTGTTGTTTESNYHVVANMPKNAAGNYEYKVGHIYQGTYGVYLCTDSDKESNEEPITQAGWQNLGRSSTFLPPNGSENYVLMWKYGAPNWVDKFELLSTVYSQYEANQRFALKSDVKTYKAGPGVSISADYTISSTATGGSGGTSYDDTQVRSDIASLQANKVNVEANKSLITDEERSKLARLQQGITSSSLQIAGQQLTLITSAGNSTVTLPTSTSTGSAGDTVTGLSFNSDTGVIHLDTNQNTFSTNINDLELKDGAVATSKVQPGAITYDKLSADVQSRFGSGGSGTASLSNVIDLIPFQFNPIIAPQDFNSPVEGTNFKWHSSYATGKKVYLEVTGCGNTATRSPSGSLFTLDGQHVAGSTTPGGYGLTIGSNRSNELSLVDGQIYRVHIAYAGTKYYSVRLIIM